MMRSRAAPTRAARQRSAPHQAPGTGKSNDRVTQNRPSCNYSQDLLRKPQVNERRAQRYGANLQLTSFNTRRRQSGSSLSLLRFSPSALSYKYYNHSIYYNHKKSSLLSSASSSTSLASSTSASSTLLTSHRFFFSGTRVAQQQPPPGWNPPGTIEKPPVTKDPNDTMPRRTEMSKERRDAIYGTGAEFESSWAPTKVGRRLQTFQDQVVPRRPKSYSAQTQEYSAFSAWREFLVTRYFDRITYGERKTFASRLKLAFHFLLLLILALLFLPFTLPYRHQISKLCARFLDESTPLALKMKILRRLSWISRIYNIRATLWNENRESALDIQLMTVFMQAAMTEPPDADEETLIQFRALGYRGFETITLTSEVQDALEIIKEPLFSQVMKDLNAQGEVKSAAWSALHLLVLLDTIRTSVSEKAIRYIVEKMKGNITNTYAFGVIALLSQEKENAVFLAKHGIIPILENYICTAGPYISGINKDMMKQTLANIFQVLISPPVTFTDKNPAYKRAIISMIEEMNADPNLQRVVKQYIRDPDIMDDYTKIWKTNGDVEPIFGKRLGTEMMLLIMSSLAWSFVVSRFSVSLRPPQGGTSIVTGTTKKVRLYRHPQDFASVLGRVFPASLGVYLAVRTLSITDGGGGHYFPSLLTLPVLYAASLVQYRYWLPVTLFTTIIAPSAHDKSGLRFQEEIKKTGGKYNAFSWLDDYELRSGAVAHKDKPDMIGDFEIDRNPRMK